MLTAEEVLTTGDVQFFPRRDLLVSLKESSRPSPLGALLNKIASRDTDALSEFYDTTRGLVFGLALRILRNPADAEEVAMDVYAQVWKTAGSFDPARSPASSWLVMLTRSRALDRLRSTGHRMQQSTEPIDTTANHRVRPIRPCDPEAEYAWTEERRRIRSALQQLPPKQRALIELAFFAGHTHAELAQSLDQPLGTIKSRVKAALTALKAHLSRWGDFQQFEENSEALVFQQQARSAVSIKTDRTASSQMSKQRAEPVPQVAV